jgi:hypothetical protein
VIARRATAVAAVDSAPPEHHPSNVFSEDTEAASV